ncbi:calcium-binding protein [Rhizobium sp. FKY42]|uniref:calcium-binding protein n=1 Tax=Rhizobium sp. FKY42 TaxID=2562310 RepID=UPI0010C1147D|nr:calcium-binding protein [Rhizobium sp. FKY42]
MLLTINSTGDTIFIPNVGGAYEVPNGSSTPDYGYFVGAKPGLVFDDLNVGQGWHWTFGFVGADLEPTPIDESFKSAPDDHLNERNDEPEVPPGYEYVPGTPEDDVIIGTDNPEYIYSGDGDDTVAAGGGDDIIIAGSGKGNDSYDGGAGFDTIKFESTQQGTTVDLASQTAAGAEIDSDTLINIESVVGGSGDDIIIGDDVANRIEAGGGNDDLQGGWGSDTYVFGSGDGADVIDDWADPSSTDVLELGPGISPGSVAVDRGSAVIWDIVLDFGGGDSVTIKGGFFVGSSVVEEVRFADNTVWDVSDLRQIHLDQKATGGNDTIEGFIDVNDLIHGKEGDDTIYAFSGNDTIYGDAGDDTIFGGEGGDTIIGGAGSDFIIGDAGSDVFVLNTGDGEDWINDFEVGVDKIDLSSITSIVGFSDLTATAAEWVAGSTWLYTDVNNYVRLEGVALSSLQANDFIFA